MRPLAAALVVAALVAALPARAEDRRSALDAPAPPTLPSLAHPRLTNTFEITAASIDPGSGRGRAAAFYLHDELEIPIVSRVFYVGAAHDIAVGAVPGVGRQAFFGAPEIWMRGLWSSVIGLSSGGGFGVVLPAPRRFTDDDREMFATMRVVRPWDAPVFNDLTVTLRPWIDVRHLVGPFILQLRQGMDIAVVARARKPGERRTDITARTAFYLGFRLSKPIGVGVELWEVYQISADLPDDRRAAFSVSPSVRLSLGRIEPALSLLFPLATPLRGEAASYFAARLSVGFELDRTPRED